MMSPESSLYRCAGQTQSRYPLNSPWLTTWHLGALAQALGLPTTGYQDQLRQCIEGTIQRDHDYQNSSEECMFVLADADG